MRKIHLAIALFITTVFTLKAQIIPCATDETYRAAIIKNPLLLQEEEKANASVRNQMLTLLSHKAGTIRYIPVVFHIMVDTNTGFENISQAQIMDQLRVINEDFRKKAGTNGGSSTDPLAVDMEVEFRLAQYDPNGNKHDGINRIITSMTNDADDAIKSLSYWDSNRYLNVWVVKSINANGSPGTVLGRAVFPWNQPSAPTVDGILIRQDRVGTVGSAVATDFGRTLTHEIGHWLGLFHTFQGGCVGGLSSNCNSQGDQVCDTPPVSVSSSGCPTSQNTCTNDVPDKPDMFKNYMDYADGDCANLYTVGQKTRAVGLSFTGNNYRGNVVKTTNLNAAGIDANGNYLPVPAAAIKAPYTYDFEDANPATAGWKINNFNTPKNGWQIVSTADVTGQKSISMRNFLNSAARINSRDGFQSPEIDLTTLTAANPTLTFYYAYAQRSTVNNDSMMLYISNNFGMQEAYLWRNAGANMATGDMQSTEFIPTATQWKKVVVDLTPYKSYNNARFRFEVLNRRGNNFFIDQFSINNFTGVDEPLANSIGFSMYPNPTAGKATISFTLPTAKSVKVELKDITGKTLQTLVDATISTDKFEHSFQTESFASGLYFVTVQVGDNSFTQKLHISQ
jgi:hypothetical protein